MIWYYTLSSQNLLSFKVKLIYRADPKRNNKIYFTLNPISDIM